MDKRPRFNNVDQGPYTELPIGDFEDIDPRISPLESLPRSELLKREKELSSIPAGNITQLEYEELIGLRNTLGGF